MFTPNSVRLAAFCTLAVALATPAPAARAQEKLRIGVVTHLTGPAAGPFGIPARNGAEIVLEASTGVRCRRRMAPRASAGSRRRCYWPTRPARRRASRRRCAASSSATGSTHSSAS